MILFFISVINGIIKCGSALILNRSRNVGLAPQIRDISFRKDDVKIWLIKIVKFGIRYQIGIKEITRKKTLLTTSSFSICSNVCLFV